MELAGVEAGAKMFVGLRGGVVSSVAAADEHDKTEKTADSAPIVFERLVMGIRIGRFLSEPISHAH